MNTYTSIQENVNNPEYSNLSELMAATDIKTGNYVLPLYGFKTFIHQKPNTENGIHSTNTNCAKITAYQTDNQGLLHFIADV